MVGKKDEEHRKTTTALLKKTEGVFKHHGHYITQNFDLSSLTGLFLKNIFILFRRRFKAIKNRHECRYILY